MTGALIITNLTRNDQSAKSILADNRQPDVKLVEQLKYFAEQLHHQLDQMTDEQAKVAHGILGALRNLAVPSKSQHCAHICPTPSSVATNRPLMVNSDVLDHVLPYLFVKNFSGEIAYKGKASFLTGPVELVSFSDGCHSVSSAGCERNVEIGHRRWSSFAADRAQQSSNASWIAV